jgi:transposase
LQLQNEEEQLIGEKQRHEPMFYYVRMEDMVPENHLLRLVDKHIDLGFIREKVKHLYSHTGRPSIDPEVLLRMLLIGYLYGITSERRLCEEVKMHIGYRWFVGLSLEEKVPDHSTFSKNRHERFAENNIFQEIFDEIVSQCVGHGLLTGKHLTVDSTYIKANASFKSLEPIVVDMNGKEYIEKLKEENPVGDRPWEPGEDYPHKGKRIRNATHRSKTDPDARLGRKSYKATTELYYSATYVMDNKSRIVVGTDVGEPDKKTDCNKAIEQIRKAKWRHRIEPESLGADKGYSAGTFLNNLLNENIQPHVPIVKYEAHNHKGIYHREEFQYDKNKNVCICPAGKEMKYWGLHKHNTQQVYRASVKDCKPCSQKPLCTKDRARSVSCHLYENAIQKVKQLNETKEYRISQRKRKLIEELFGEAKEYMGLRVSKFRRMIFVREQVLMTAAAQNIKRMVKLLSGRGPLKEAMAGISAFHLLFADAIEILFLLYKNINKAILGDGNILAEV